MGIADAGLPGLVSQEVVYLQIVELRFPWIACRSMELFQNTMQQPYCNEYIVSITNAKLPVLVL